VFQGVPVWMLALEPSRVGNVYIVGHDSQTSLVEWLNSKDKPGSIIERLLGRFGSNQLKFWQQVARPSINGLTLVSGSLHYIDSIVSVLSAGPQMPVVGVVDHHFHGRLRNGRPSGL
jgi:hypothetical protein